MPLVQVLFLVLVSSYKKIFKLYRYHCIVFLFRNIKKGEIIMKKINKGIVFSEDIKRILNGINAFDYI